MRAKEELEAYEPETIRDFFSFSASDVHDALLFLEQLLKPTWDTTEVYRQRAMLAALALYGRARDIQNELGDIQDELDGVLTVICDNGYTAMDKNRTFERSKKVVRDIGSRLSDKVGLKTSILRTDLLQEVVYKITGTSVKSMSANELYESLLRKL